MGHWHKETSADVGRTLVSPQLHHGHHHITMTHLFLLPAGFCPPSSPVKAMPGDQGHEESWDPEETATLSLRSPHLRETLGELNLWRLKGDHSTPLSDQSSSLVSGTRQWAR